MSASASDDSAATFGGAAKAKEETTKKVTLWGSIFSALAFGLGIFFKGKSWLPKISFQGSVK
jgi:hypothetical protein